MFSIYDYHVSHDSNFAVDINRRLHERYSLAFYCLKLCKIYCAYRSLRLNQEKCVNISQKYLHTYSLTNRNSRILLQTKHFNAKLNLHGVLNGLTSSVRRQECINSNLLVLILLV